jgi:hypothetical protein
MADAAPITGNMATLTADIAYAPSTIITIITITITTTITTATITADKQTMSLLEIEIH